MIYRTTYRTASGRKVATTWTNPGAPEPTPDRHATTAEHYADMYGEVIVWTTEEVPESDMPWPTNPARLEQSA